MKKIHVLFGALVVFGVGLYAASPALASVYEWITTAEVSCTGSPSCHVNNWLTPSWTLNTSESFDEYRTVYYVITPSSTRDIPGDDAPWTQVHGCDLHGFVSGSSNEFCFFRAPESPPGSGGTYFLDLRITTNYAGCGSWTPNPTAHCGDIQVKRVWVTN